MRIREGGDLKVMLLSPFLWAVRVGRLDVMFLAARKSWGVVCLAFLGVPSFFWVGLFWPDSSSMLVVPCLRVRHEFEK